MVALAQRPEVRVKDNPTLNELERILAQCPQQPIPTLHFFTGSVEDGTHMYVRSVIMAKGSIFTSKIHKTEHPFVVSAGSCTVCDGEGHRELIRAPHLGVTKPGTRRALLIREDCIWTTFHATNLTSVDEIEKEIIEPHFIPEVADGSRAQFDIFIERKEIK